MAQAISNPNLKTKQEFKNPLEQDLPREGRLTKAIEKQTAKVPSVGYLGLAVGSMLISAGVMIFARRKEAANFIGLWAPSLLLIGIYNKLVKLEGYDQFDKAA